MFQIKIEISANCKTERIQEELHSGQMDLWLLAVVVAVCAHVLARFGKIPEITEILRTREEQRAIYPDRPGLRSVHEFWRGADLVVRGLGADEHEEICEWINKRFDYGKPGYQTCTYHNAGTGFHLHLQVRPIR